ncbi:hypothetical protein GB937_008871 [Aspergillus fischeri]|nr:hypothetical protein GB937_008871 [Aspergillus fischeri]
MKNLPELLIFTLETISFPFHFVQFFLKSPCHGNFNVIVGREIAKVPLEYVTVALTILPSIGVAWKGMEPYVGWGY